MRLVYNIIVVKQFVARKEIIMILDVQKEELQILSEDFDFIKECL